MAIKTYINKYRNYACDELAELLKEPGIDSRMITALIYMRGRAAEETVKEQKLIDQMTEKYNLFLEQFVDSLKDNS